MTTFFCLQHPCCLPLTLTTPQPLLAASPWVPNALPLPRRTPAACPGPSPPPRLSSWVTLPTPGFRDPPWVGGSSRDPQALEHSPWGGDLPPAQGVGLFLTRLPARPGGLDQLPLSSGGWDLLAKDSGRGTQVRVEAPQDLPLSHLYAGPREPSPGWVGLTALSHHRAPSHVHTCLLARLGEEGAHPTAWSFPVWRQRPEHPWVPPAALAELDRPGPYGSTHLIP